MTRLDYEASCRRLHEMGFPDCDPPPPLPNRSPKPDDEGPLGVSFFRTSVGNDLSGLTLPRTFFGRSEIGGVSFRDTDLHESTLCWNDFIDVDFSNAVLRGADLRASLFERVTFAGADLRISSFLDCRFEGAAMKGATLTRAQGESLALSPQQRAEINWVDEGGDEPEGG
jgi:BTB/POZ domain-containing protein KCTD9